jgi:hypothetical protein
MRHLLYKTKLPGTPAGNRAVKSNYKQLISLALVPAQRRVLQP